MVTQAESRNSRQELNERTAPLVSQVVLERESVPASSGGVTRLRVKGVFQKVDVRNENNRRYPGSVWEKNLAPDSSLTQRIGARSVLGELEHPEAGVTHLSRVSHLIERIWREGLGVDNPYKVEPGDYVLGEALIFNTPPGRILQELYECNVPVGVSSRGRGDVVTDSDGVDVVQDNYEADTWDFVCQPSVEEAKPEPVREGAKEDPVVDEALLERGYALIAEGASAQIADLVEVRSKVEERAQRSSGQYNSGEERTVQGLLESCGKKLFTVITERESSSAPEPEPEKRKEAKQTRRSTVSQKEYAAVVAVLAGRTVRAEAMAQRLKEAGDDPSSETGKGSSHWKRRYEAAVAIADGLLTKARRLRLQLKETGALKRTADAAVKLASRLRQRLLGSGVQGFVEKAIEKDPQLAGAKKLLLECKTSKEVQDKVELLQSVQSTERQSEHEPVIESIKTPATGREETGKKARKPLTLVERVAVRFEGRKIED